MQRRSFIQTALAALGFASIGVPTEAKQTTLRQEDLLDKRFTRSHGIYATKGEWITCERGHKIAQFGRDVNYGDMFDPSALANWQQLEPEHGKIIHPCIECGGHFFAGTQFNFENGWRV